MGNICPSNQRRELRHSSSRLRLSDIIPDSPSLNERSADIAKLSVLPKQEQVIRFYERQSQLQGISQLPGLSRSKSLSFSNALSPKNLDSTLLRLKDELLSSRSNYQKSQNLGAILSLPEFLDSSDIEKVFRSIFEISVNYCPLLAIENFAGDCLRERELANYQNILRSQREIFVLKMKKMHPISIIPRPEFLEFLSKYDFIFSTSKLREHILKHI